LTIETKPFTTSRSRVTISGTIERGAALGVKLNDESLDELLLTLTEKGKSWTETGTS